MLSFPSRPGPVLDNYLDQRPPSSEPQVALLVQRVLNTLELSLARNSAGVQPCSRGSPPRAVTCAALLAAGRSVLLPASCWVMPSVAFNPSPGATNTCCKARTTRALLCLQRAHRTLPAPGTRSDPAPSPLPCQLQGLWPSFSSKPRFHRLCHHNLCFQHCLTGDKVCGASLRLIPHS